MNNYHIKIEYYNLPNQFTQMSARDNAEAMTKTISLLTQAEKEEVSRVTVEQIRNER